MNEEKWFTLLATLTMVAALGTSVSAAPVVPSADTSVSVSASEALTKDQATSETAVDQSEQAAQKVVTKYLTAMHEKNFSDAVIELILTKLKLLVPKKSPIRV
ncbi:hypothetical protein MJ749_04670 [Paenibacillus polymyxa]|uniref:hypothetical protein n=1 Tax=Paenibacillus polymyxa TaxID=1406 RepID=UPI001F0FBEE4|nr:hypothetical protein [Paenibacillus polymyxa]UMR36727.1 hypothetical protein MJ749_04670 [Paenibacillus polymyxa]